MEVDPLVDEELTAQVSQMAMDVKAAMPPPASPAPKASAPAEPPEMPFINDEELPDFDDPKWSAWMNYKEEQAAENRESVALVGYQALPSPISDPSAIDPAEDRGLYPGLPSNMSRQDQAAFGAASSLQNGRIRVGRP